VKLRVARKVLDVHFYRVTDRLIAGLPIFPARDWPWNGNYRSSTLLEACRVSLRATTRRILRAAANAGEAEKGVP
jgi:hypothetical protein